MQKIISRALAIAGALSILVSNLRAVEFTEHFSANPFANGWQIFGDTNLFQWDSTNHDIAVTWDSSQPNSYFYRPLGLALSSSNSFSFSFDIKLNDAAIEGGTFQLAVGLLNYGEATNANFLRGTGYNSTDEVEFDYFMDPYYGNSVAATQIDTNGYIADVYDDVSFDTNTTYHISVTHFAGDPLISAQVLVSNVVYTYMLNSYVEGGFGDYNVDTIAIMSFNDTGAYGASILAHGTVGNFSFTSNPTPVGNYALKHELQGYAVQFQSYSNWVYTTERSTDLKNWSAISGASSGTGTVLEFIDTNSPPNQAFYRVHAQR